MPFSNEVLVANGTTSLGRVVFCKAVLDLMINSAVIDMVVNVGGTGYVVGETFDIVGGVSISSFVARGIVTSESAGVVTGIKFISSGAYSTLPGVTGAVTANSSAAGNDDLTVDLTTQVPQWTQDRSTYVDDATDFEFLCTSIKASNPPTVGMVSVTGSGNDSSQLVVASGFDGGQTFAAQPDASPITQMFLNIPATNPEIFISITERVVNPLARDGNNVQYGGMGLFIPRTNAEASYPFPGIVHAQSAGIRAMSAQYNNDANGNANAGILHPNVFGSVFGAYRYRDNLSAQWLTIAEIASDAGARSMIWPHKQIRGDYNFTLAPQVSGQSTDPWVSSTRTGKFGDATGNGSTGAWFENPNAAVEGVQGVSPFGTGQQMSMTVTSYIISSQTGDTHPIGIIDGYEAVHGIGLTAFEEIESFNSNSRYIVFPDTNGADLGQWVAMEIR